LNIVVFCADPILVQPGDAQLSAVWKNECSGFFVDPEAQMFFDLHRLVGDHEFLHDAIELRARWRRLHERAKRDKYRRVPDTCRYPISVPKLRRRSRPVVRLMPLVSIWLDRYPLTEREDDEDRCHTEDHDTDEPMRNGHVGLAPPIGQSAASR
jgi:hypothetical protein